MKNRGKRRHDLGGESVKNRGCLVQENGSVIVGVLAGVNRGNGHSIRSDRRSMDTAEVHLIVVVCHATRPDEGAIVEGAGGRVNHWKMGGEEICGGALLPPLWCSGKQHVADLIDGILPHPYAPVFQFAEVDSLAHQASVVPSELLKETAVRVGRFPSEVHCLSVGDGAVGICDGIGHWSGLN